ncbi:DNA-directed RNA polymerase subunit beta [candidate division TA06 bacterium]|uniref:DNA-directed RNA polymerase subunit beta n=1 Tax=candidate division TA06 bacterium TaxID=2250710 RepID=A0A523UT40_UNCT6|nr:MAG: DNA-directed RNA polymerase subunit beta [candidate division TA06 bacterium]
MKDDLTVSFSKIGSALDLPDLLEVQLESFARFLQASVPPEKRKKEGLQAVLSEIFPIEDIHGRFTLEFMNYRLGRPKYSDEEAERKGVTYARPLVATFRLITKDKEDERARDIIEQEVFLGDLPLMTSRGTFIVNGVERVVVSQLHRSPGAYFTEALHPSGKMLYAAQLLPYRGSWMEFSTDANDILLVSLDKKRRFPATILLRAIGFSSTSSIVGLFCGKETLAVDSKKSPQKSKLVGRIISTDVVNTRTGEVICEALSEIKPELIELLQEKKVKKIDVITEEDETDISILRSTLAKDSTRSEKEALEKIHFLLRGSLPASYEAARAFFDRMFFTPRRYELKTVGRHKINSKLGLKVASNVTTLTREDIVGAIKYMLGLRKGEGSLDDIDHLGNRRVRRVGELLENQMNVAFSRMARAIRERMVLRDTSSLTPQELINARLIAGIVMSFFASSQLSQFMEQTNPMTELTHKRRLSALGPGGLTRETAGFEVRDVHHSHYGRICPIETPEGANIGLISSLCTYSRINELGFIETPYRRVEGGHVTRKIEYLSADDEEEYAVAQANTPLDSKGKMISNRILSRKRDAYPVLKPEEVDYMDVSPKQLVSAAAALIPFLEHDDANRALMGSNMQRQAVPLILSENPVVGTGLEKRIAIDSRAVVVAERSGIVERVASDEIVIRPKEKGAGILEEYSLDRYRLTKFKRTNQDTCVNQRPLVREGQQVKAGDIIADGPATKDGKLALGMNVLVAFMPWGGYNFEDAVVISERLLKDDKFTSIHIEEFECEVRETKLGPEEITREIPNVGEEALRNLDEDGIVRVGAEVGSEDILVGKVSPKGETELTPEEKLLRAIFGEKASDVRDTSLRVPPGVTGVVVDVRVFSRKGNTNIDKKKEQRKIEEVRKDADKQKRGIEKLKREKLCSLLLGKQCNESVRDRTGTVVIRKGTTFSEKNLSEVEICKLNIPYEVVKEKPIASKIDQVMSVAEEILHQIDEDKNNEIDKAKRGDELPQGVLKKVEVFVAQRRRLSVGDKMAGRHGNKGVIAKIVPDEDMPYMEDGTPVEIVLNPLGVPSRMNVGQILETHLGWAAKALGLTYVTPVFEGATVEEIKQELAKAKLPANGKARLIDGRSGKPFAEDIVVGFIYMMKLSHMVDDKIHARSTGPYSLITQQPLGGKAQLGGQRFGEMEVWALEAYGAAHTLQEILTVKSDDVVGRSKLYESIVKGENPPEPGLPASFNVLIKELNGLCLDVLLERQE